MLIENTPTSDEATNEAQDPPTDLRAVWLGIAAAIVLAVMSRETGLVLGVPLMVAGVTGLTDQRTERLPNKQTGFLFAITMLWLAIASYGAGYGSFTGALAGAAIWSVPLFVMAVIGRFGGGDFKFAASLGAMCGWLSVPTAVVGLVVALFACCAVGAVVAWRARTMKTPLRLGLPLYVGTVATLAISSL